MSHCPTVKVKSPNHEQGFFVINEEDFDESKHEAYVELTTEQVQELADQKAAEDKAAEDKAAEDKAAEDKAAEDKAAEDKAAEDKAQVVKAATKRR